MISEKQTTRKIVGLLLLAATLLSVQPLPAQTLRQEMDKLHGERGVNFVYDAALPVAQPYSGPSLSGMPLDAALQSLFSGTAISFRRQGHYVLLKADDGKKPKPKNAVLQHFTVSGYVSDESGERLLSATIYDLNSCQGTTTNSHGYYSITLAEGLHSLRYSYLGYADTLVTVDLRKNEHKDMAMSLVNNIDEVIVEGDMNSPLLTTQTGKRTLSAKDINTGYALLSSPDVVKTLQRLSGVQEGIELASGLYVHGGNGDENLFLIDGTPLYQVNHMLGLFSSFNTDVVKTVDFFKSGFPARYGGRLSSVIDVRTGDGDMLHTHGSYRIGLLEGAFHLEGPIGKKDRGNGVRGIDYGTSYNIGLRRSWLDLITRPTFAVINHSNDPDEDFSLDYAFHDLNAKLTHIFSSRSRAYISIYSGIDKFSTDDEYMWQNDEGTIGDRDMTKNRFNWGNFNAALNWNYQLTPRLFANFTAFYTLNRARYSILEDDRSWWKVEGKLISVFRNEHGYRSTIGDAGYRSEFDYRPSPRHHIRFGHDYTHHLFRPQTHNEMAYYGNDENTDTVAASGSNRHRAHELTFYAEDELTLNNRWSLNAGLNINCFRIQQKTFFSSDPRLAVKFQLAQNLSAKASYTMMSQFVHKISNAFLELPTDYWVPTTERLHPMRSRQMAVGLYWQPVRQLLLTAEGYYKRTNHLLQYSNWSGLEPPATKWDQSIMEGKGMFYGIELDAGYSTKYVQLTAAYTLSWNKRYYKEFYDGWYFDKFDNRHKVNLNARVALGRQTEAYAAWTFHTGNHLTFPTQYVPLPGISETKDDGGHAYGDNYYGETRWEFIYEHPNNIVLPAYHRLDLGFNFRHQTKAGHERIWNLSVYNAYCHLNSMWIDVDYRSDGSFSMKNKGFIPIIPSVSYTIKF